MADFKCPNCGKELLVKNNILKSGLVLKSKLVFLNPDGQIMCRCKICREIVAIPLVYNQNNGSIGQK